MDTSGEPVLDLVLRRHHKLRTLPLVASAAISLALSVASCLGLGVAGPAALTTYWLAASALASSMVALALEATAKPYRVAVYGNGEVEFEAYCRRWRVPVSEIAWVKGLVPEWSEIQDGWLQRLFGWRPVFTYGSLLHSSCGYVWLQAHEHEFSDLIVALHRGNPAIEVIVWRQRWWSPVWERQVIRARRSEVGGDGIFGPSGNARSH